jgi:hypothetical protein
LGETYFFPERAGTYLCRCVRFRFLLLVEEGVRPMLSK